MDDWTAQESERDTVDQLLDGAPAGSIVEAPARPRAEVTPPVGMRPVQLRRERSRLEEARERSLRELGGLDVEMAKRERMRVDLLGDRAAIVLGLTAQMDAIDQALSPPVPEEEPVVEADVRDEPS